MVLVLTYLVKLTDANFSNVKDFPFTQGLFHLGICSKDALLISAMKEVLPDFKQGQDEVKPASKNDYSEKTGKNTFLIPCDFVVLDVLVLAKQKIQVGSEPVF